MSDKIKYYEKQPVSFRLTPEEVNELNDYYEDITGSTQDMNFKQFYLKVWDKATTSVKPIFSKKEDVAKIQKLESDIETFKKTIADNLDEFKTAQALISSQEEEIEALREKNDELSDKGPEKVLKNEIETLKEEIRLLSGRKPEKVIEKVIEKVNVEIPVHLSENQTLVNLSPVEADIMKLVVKNETVRTKRTITPEILFKDIFNRYSLNGACDFFPIPSKQALREIANKHNINPKD